MAEFFFSRSYFGSWYDINCWEGADQNQLSGVCMRLIGGERRERDQSSGPVTCSLSTATSSFVRVNEEEITIHLTSRSCMSMRQWTHRGLCSKVHRSTWPAAPHLSLHRNQAGRATLTLALFSLHKQFAVWMHAFVLKITAEKFQAQLRSASYLHPWQVVRKISCTCSRQIPGVQSGQ